MAQASHRRRGKTENNVRLGTSSESTNACSSGGTSGGICGGSTVVKFSSVGQQFGNCSSSHSSTNRFSMEAHLQPKLSSSLHRHTNYQEQLPSHHQSQTVENGIATSASHQNLPQAFLFGAEQRLDVKYGDQRFPHGSLGEFPKESSSQGPFPLTSMQAISNSLTLLQQKIQQLQGIVHLMAQGNRQSVVHQQAVASGVASIISQLLVATAGMLQQSAEPTSHTIGEDLQLNRSCGAIGSGFNINQQTGLGNGFVTDLGSLSGSSHGNVARTTGGSALLGGSSIAGVSDSGLACAGIAGNNLGAWSIGSSCGTSQNPFLANGINHFLEMGFRANEKLGAGNDRVARNSSMVHNTKDFLQDSLEEQGGGIGGRDDDEDVEAESLPPGSYEVIEMDAIEILAEHTHFCEICGKGFKRDANLRMHMRGHGDEYKTPAALARPDKTCHEASLIRVRRYSCPYVGCKRNMKHSKFQPLKTILCVKNHYRRSHCPKMLMCSKCKTKRFSVVADLKTHEKHCGLEKWQCSCGTTFSRKDKLFGHIGLFVGHMPALALRELEATGRGDLVATGSSGFNTSNSSAASHSGGLTGSGSNHFSHGNRLSADTVNGNVGRDSGLQSLESGCGSFSLSDDSNGASLRNVCISPTGLIVPGSSMFQGLVSSNFLQQANDDIQNSTGGL